MFDPRLQTVTAIIHSLGEIAEAQRKLMKVEKKDDGSLVTNADKKIEETFRKNILEFYPDDGFIGEEGDNIESRSGYSWVIDPIDGTTNYSKNIPMYSVNICILKDKELFAGATLINRTNELFLVEKGKGVFLNDEKVELSNVQDLDQSIVAFEFRNNDKNIDTNLELYPKVLKSVQKIRMFGTVANDLAYLASGRLDLVMKPESTVWDVGTGVLMIRELDGKVVDFNGEEWVLDSESLIAGNEILVNQMVRIVNSQSELN